MGSVRLITIAICATLLFGFNAGHFLTPDIIPGDAVGFEIPLPAKLFALVVLGASIYRFHNPRLCAPAIVICFIAGIHVSFEQAGSLNAYLSGVLPLGFQIPVCHNDSDNALTFLEQPSTDSTTLSTFHDTIACEGKSGSVLGYGYIWYRTGPS